MEQTKNDETKRGGIELRDKKNVIEDILYELKKHEEQVDAYKVPNTNRFDKLKKELFSNG